MLLSHLFSDGEVTSGYCVQSWASPTEVVLGVNLQSSLTEDAKGADGSHGLKKREDTTTEDSSAGNTLMEEKSAWKTTNYIDTTSNLVKDLSSKLLEPCGALWSFLGMYSYVLVLFFSNKYLLVTAAEGMIRIQV